MKASPVRAGALSLLLLLPLLFACRPNTPSPLSPLPSLTAQPTPALLPTATIPADAAAVVNGRVITQAVFEAQASAAIEAYRQQTGGDDGQVAEQAIRAQVLDLLIDQVLVEQAAAREGVTVDDAQVDAQVEQARAQNPDGFPAWLAANGLTEDTFRAQTRANLLAAAMRERVSAEVGKTVEQVHLRQIVVQTEAEAREILQQVQSGSATFEDLAGEHSLEEAGRANGGDIGFVPRGVLAQSLEEVAFGLEPGQIAGPIEGRSGWHVIKLVERDPAREVPPEMLITLQQEMFARWLQEERAHADIGKYVE